MTSIKIWYKPNHSTFSDCNYRFVEILEHSAHIAQKRILPQTDYSNKNL